MTINQKNSLIDRYICGMIHMKSATDNNIFFRYTNSHIFAGTFPDSCRYHQSSVRQKACFNQIKDFGYNVYSTRNVDEGFYEVFIESEGKSKPFSIEKKKIISSKVILSGPFGSTENAVKSENAHKILVARYNILVEFAVKKFLGKI